LAEKIEEQDIAFTHSIVYIEREIDNLREKTARQIKEHANRLCDIELAMSDIRHRLDTIEIRSSLDVLNNPPKKNVPRVLFCKVICAWLLLSLVLFLSWVLYDIYTSPPYPIVIPYYTNYKYVMY
jgi:hypothetical protein